MQHAFKTIMVIALILSIDGSARAADYQLTTHVLGGGGISVGNSVVLEGTLGQAEAGMLTGSSYTLDGGFWATVTPPAACPSDTDGDHDVDLADLALILSQFGETGNGLTGDVDSDGDVDLSDLSLVLANYGESCQ